MLNWMLSKLHIYNHELFKKFYTRLSFSYSLRFKIVFRLKTDHQAKHILIRIRLNLNIAWYEEKMRYFWLVNCKHPEFYDKFSALWFNRVAQASLLDSLTHCPHSACVYQDSEGGKMKERLRASWHFSSARQTKSGSDTNSFLFQMAVWGSRPRFSRSSRLLSSLYPWLACLHMRIVFLLSLALFVQPPPVKHWIYINKYKHTERETERKTKNGPKKQQNAQIYSKDTAYNDTCVRKKGILQTVYAEQMREWLEKEGASQSLCLKYIRQSIPRSLNSLCYFGSWNRCRMKG